MRIRVRTPSSIPPGVTKPIHMTVLAQRYDTRRARTGRRFISESRKAQMEQLRERIDRGEYSVDPRQVADAIVRRLLHDQNA